MNPVKPDPNAPCPQNGRINGVHVWFTTMTTQTMQYEEETGKEIGPALYQVKTCRLCGAEKASLQTDAWLDTQTQKEPIRAVPKHDEGTGKDRGSDNENPTT